MENKISGRNTRLEKGVDGVESLSSIFSIFHESSLLTQAFFLKQRNICAATQCLECINFMKIGQPKLSGKGATVQLNGTPYSNMPIVSTPGIYTLHKPVGQDGLNQAAFIPEILFFRCMDDFFSISFQNSLCEMPPVD